MKKINLQEETFAKLEYFGESLILRNVAVRAVREGLFSRKFLLAKISFLFVVGGKLLYAIMYNVSN